MHTVTYPKSSLFYRSYLEYLSAPVKIVIGSNFTKSILTPGYKYNPEDVIQDEVYISHTEDVEQVSNYIFTPIGDRYIFNDQTNSGSDMLSDNWLSYYDAVPDECILHDDGRYGIQIDDRVTYNYRIIPHPNHKTIADLMKWGHCYTFINNTWVYDDNKQNHLMKYLKAVIRLSVSDHVGDEVERISDYSKLVYWLMYQHKDKLSQENVEVLEQLVPDQTQLTKLLKRDLFIHDIIARILSEKLPSHYEFEL